MNHEHLPWWLALPAAAVLIVIYIRVALEESRRRDAEIDALLDAEDEWV